MLSAEGLAESYRAELLDAMIGVCVDVGDWAAAQTVVDAAYNAGGMTWGLHEKWTRNINEARNRQAVIV